LQDVIGDRLKIKDYLRQVFMEQSTPGKNIFFFHTISCMSRGKINGETMKHREREKILFIHGGALGDGILSLPAIYAVRDAFPGAAITLIGHPERWKWVRPAPFEKILPLERMSLERLFVPAGPIPPTLEALLGEFRLAVSWHGNGDFEKNLLSFLRGTLLFRPFRPSALTVHASDFFLNTLKPLGIPLAADIPSLEAPPVPEPVPNLPAEPVILHPGSGSRLKCWPPENFVRLAEMTERLLRRPCRFLIGEADRWILEEPSFRTPEMGTRVLMNLSLSTVAAILKKGRAYVGNDSGISHMAAVLGIPALVVFTATDPRIWAPRGRHVRVLRDRKGDLTADTACKALKSIVS